MAAGLIELAGSPRQRERWLPGFARGELTGALAAAEDGGAELVIGGADADVIVLVYEDRTARALTPAECELVPIASIDPTRSAARVSASLDAGEELADDVAGGVDRALVAISSELVGVCDRALELTLAYVKERRPCTRPRRSRRRQDRGRFLAARSEAVGIRSRVGHHCSRSDRRR